MELNWIPISPDLKVDGSFKALDHLENSDELKPMLPTSEHKYSMFKVVQAQVDMAVAAKLKLFTALTAEANSGMFAFLYEASIYSDVTSDIPVGNIIYGTRYGTGYRIMLKVTNMAASANLSITSIAAEATMHRASVQFELFGFGFPNDPSILSDAPTPGDFNVDAWAKISEWTNKLKDYLRVNKDKLCPQPYQILADQDKIMDTTYEFQSYLFGYKKIFERKCYNDAIRVAGRKYNPFIIKEVYNSFDLKAQDTPDTTMSIRAQKVFTLN